MLPNRFPDGNEAPEFNSVDASLWYVIAVQELLGVMKLPAHQRRRLIDSIDAIVAGYAGERGTGSAPTKTACCGRRSGLQLTWMDAKVGDHVVTPRIGKPVESRPCG